jgi:hypothetical protein
LKILKKNPNLYNIEGIMAKEYNEKEAAQILAKSMWKAVKKTMGKNPISDVVDSNMTREAAPATVPADKESVMNKAPTEKDVSAKGPAVQPTPNPPHDKAKKLKGFVAKRKDKLKNTKKL